MEFEWDEQKNHINFRKHKINFEFAKEVFNDPLAISKIDRVVDGEVRWIATGMACGQCLLVVAHTYRNRDDKEVIRIISARRANSYERKRYEEG